MKKFLALGAAALALSASPAFAAAADATGQVQVTGSVAAKCTAQGGIADTIVLGELAGTDGKIVSTFPNNTGLTKQFTIVCTTANPKIEVSSTKLAITGATGSVGGYTDTVDYDSKLEADTNAGASTTASTTFHSATDATPASTTLGSGVRFRNATNNLRVTVSNGSTAQPTDLLKAGSYSSAITITVYPS